MPSRAQSAGDARCLARHRRRTRTTDARGVNAWRSSAPVRAGVAAAYFLAGNPDVAPLRGARSRIDGDPPPLVPDHPRIAVAADPGPRLEEVDVEATGEEVGRGHAARTRRRPIATRSRPDLGRPRPAAAAGKAPSVAKPTAPLRASRRVIDVSDTGSTEGFRWRGTHVYQSRVTREQAENRDPPLPLPLWMLERAPTRAQQSNTDQQMSFRNRWSSSTSSRIASGSWSRCHWHSSRPALSPSPSGAAARAALIA